MNRVVAVLRVVLGALVAGVLGSGTNAGAQVLDGRPIAFADGRVTIGGSVSATYSCADGPSIEPDCGVDPGFFNYTDYEHSVLRLLRFDVSAAVHANAHVSVLGEIRSENGAAPAPYALFVRLRPWSARRIDVQVGLVPPVFGAFARRSYPTDNLLIGYPLAYQYLTSLRADSLPAHADELLRMRGRGWLSRFSVGNSVPAAGMPLVNALRWDTGVQLHAANDLVDAAIAVTTGTQANPLVRDDNTGKQVVGRIALRPVAGLILGASGARGPYVSETAARSAGESEPFAELDQTSWGADVEYSRDHYLVRAETILSDWTPPKVTTPWLDLPLRAVSTSVEGRYKILPGLYAAARLDHLAFSNVRGSVATDSWDADVTRIELGGGYLLRRNLMLKLAVQRNTRDTTRTPSVTFVAAQAVFWF